jgi:hypothetical protein
MPGLRSILLQIFQKVTKLLWGTGAGKIPGVYAVYALLFRFLWPDKSTKEIQGSKMSVDPEGLPKSYLKTFQSYILSSSWEELTTEMFKKMVNKGDIVVGLGTNLGYYTLLAARLVGREGKVCSDRI